MLNAKPFAVLVLSLAAASTPLAHSENTPGLRFSHADWELVCSNTRACHLAGYQAEESDDGISVLLSRRAGANQPINGSVQLASGDGSEAERKLPAQFSLSLKINQRNLGKVSIDKSSLTGLLSATQVQALVAALAGKALIRFEYGSQTWQLSDRGAAAVLLKADEFQGRLGSTQAWIKKGPDPETAVLPALPKPVITRAKLPKAQPQDSHFAQKHAVDLLPVLRQTQKADDCPALAITATEKPELNAWRLSATQFLVSTLCWRAAYNEGYGYWVVNHSKPFQARLVTANGTDYSDGHLQSHQKGRGIGDCMSSQEWLWNGQEFQLSSRSFTGMCKQIMPGGAWHLKTYETEVK